MKLATKLISSYLLIRVESCGNVADRTWCLHAGCSHRPPHRRQCQVHSEGEGLQNLQEREPEPFLLLAMVKSRGRAIKALSSPRQ